MRIARGWLLLLLRAAAGGPRLVLHVGPHKTGSSSVQKFLDTAGEWLDAEIHPAKAPRYAEAVDRFVKGLTFGAKGKRLLLRRDLDAQIIDELRLDPDDDVGSQQVHGARRVPSTALEFLHAFLNHHAQTPR